MTREATNKLLQMIEEGILDKDTVIMACVKYMSEDEVADMCHHNEFFYEEEEEDDEDRENYCACGAGEVGATTCDREDCTEK